MTNSIRRDDVEAFENEDLAPAASEADDPSWFLGGANHPTREELIARYRKHFNIPEDGIAYPQRASQARTKVGYRELISTQPAIRRPSFLSSLEHEAEHTAGRPEAVASRPSLRRTYILAALGAMLAGGSAGFVASQVHVLKQVAAAITDPQAAASRNSASHVPRVVTVKPVATASLQVEDVAGPVNALIPLALSAEPAWPQKDLLLKLSGLPDKAYLTSGHREADKVWSLSLADLKDVKLMVPGPSQPEISVAVAAVEPRSGELAAPVKTMTIALSNATIVPVSSPPPQAKPASSQPARTDMPSPIPVPMNMNVTLASLQNPARDLIAQGDARLKGGDFAGARQFYERAWTSGSAQGAMAMARSFDPLLKPQLPAGTTTDRDQALQWYERAAEAGQKDAFAAIVRLKVKP